MTESEYKTYLRARDRWTEDLKQSTEDNLKADIARVSTDIWYYLTRLKIFYEETGAGDAAKDVFIKTVNVMETLQTIAGAAPSDIDLTKTGLNSDIMSK